MRLTCLLLALLISACAWTITPTPPPAWPTAIRTTTTDGWNLALYRFAPRHPEKAGAPLILIPDLFENGRVYDLDPEHSLARRLAAAGRNVVIAELRGQGGSEKPAWWNQRRADWSFDAYVQYDLPAIVETIRASAAGDRVILAGHGLGGTAGLAFMQARPEQVSGFIGFGVAARFCQLNDLHRVLLAKLDQTKDLEAIPTSQGAKAPAPFIGADQSLFDILLCNGRNWRREIVESYYTAALEPVSINVARQIGDWMRNGTFASADGQVNYLAGLRNITCPVLLISGALDNVFDPGCGRELLDRLGSADKTQRIFSETNGYLADYGHIGLLLAEHAGKEIGGYILHWLRR